MSIEVDYSNKVIDMLLLNANKDRVNTQEFDYYQIQPCIHDAIKRYPFRKHESEQTIIIQHIDNFIFYGSKILFENILFNLIKNALYSITRANKGNIYIWTSHNRDKNILHFKDTGNGMSPSIIKKTFSRFNTDTPGGSGIGLYVTKVIMLSFNGDIECQSKYGEYTHFMLYFPKTIT